MRDLTKTHGNVVELVEENPLVTLAANKAKAEGAFGRGLRQWIVGIPALDPAAFWTVMDEYAKQILTYRFYYGRSNGVEQAASEMFRKRVFDHIPADREASVTELVAFLNTFDEIHRAIGKRLKRCFDGSSDGFNDLVDSFVFLGKLGFDAIEEKPSAVQLRRIVKELIPKRLEELGETNLAVKDLPEKLFRFLISSNENYLEGGVRDAAERYLYHFFREQSKEVIEDD